MGQVDLRFHAGSPVLQLHHPGHPRVRRRITSVLGSSRSVGDGGADRPTVFGGAGCPSGRRLHGAGPQAVTFMSRVICGSLMPVPRYLVSLSRHVTEAETARPFGMRQSRGDKDGSRLTKIIAPLLLVSAGTDLAVLESDEANARQSFMSLYISSTSDSGISMLRIEGWLEGETVAELERVVNGSSGPLRLDLSELRSEERRVGKECRSRWTPYHYKKKSFFLDPGNELARVLRHFKRGQYDTDGH